MRVLDLFSGLGGWSGPWREAGHEVVTVDIDPSFSPDICADVLDLDPRDLPIPDVILASPPCETFSVASIGHHWTGGRRAYVPKTQEAVTGMALIQKTRDLIAALEPKHAIIENPRGVLRRLGLLPNPVTVWYCHYGETRAKPTDLWIIEGLEKWEPRSPCHNRREGHEPGCCCYDHEQARRGAKTGTQGIGTYALRSVIPRELSLEVEAATNEGGA